MTVVMIGGPIKAAFTGANFDIGLQGKIESLSSALTAAGVSVLSAHQHERFSPLDDRGRAQVASRDYRWSEEADVYVALLPLDRRGHLIPSFGTGVEVGWFTAAAKPVWLAIDEERLASYSPFLTSLPSVKNVNLVDLGVVDLPGIVLRIAKRTELHV
jgi:nucleoside 2-deoxyribosyltransferase